MPKGTTFYVITLSAWLNNNKDKSKAENIHIQDRKNQSINQILFV